MIAVHGGRAGGLTLIASDGLQPRMRAHLLEAARLTASGVPRPRAAQGRSSWPGYRRTRRATASQGGCPPTAEDKRKGKEIPLLATFNL